MSRTALLMLASGLLFGCADTNAPPPEPLELLLVVDIPCVDERRLEPPLVLKFSVGVGRKRDQAIRSWASPERGSFNAWR